MSAVTANGDASLSVTAGESPQQIAVEQGSRAMAEAWQSTGGPLPADEAGEALRRLSVATAALLMPNAVPDAELLERARVLGGYMGSIDMPEPEVAAPALTALARLGGPLPPERLGPMMAGIAAGLLEAARQKQVESSTTLSRQRDRLQILQAAHLAILSADSLHDILALSVRFIDALLPNLATTVVTYDFQAAEFTIEYSTRPEFAVQSRRPITLSHMIASLRQGEPYLVPDVRALPEYLPGLDTVIQVGGRSFLAVPMIYRGELIGAVTMATMEVYDFLPEEMAIVKEIANVIAVAVQDRRALQAEQQARENEATLREVAASLTLGLDLDAILNHLLFQLERVITSRSSTIVLLEDSQPVLAAQRGLQNTPEDLDELLTASRSSLGWVLDTGRPRIINDTAQNVDWHILPGLEFIRAWMGVPLLVKGVCIGALTLDREQPNSFTPHENDLVLAFANQAAIAIENARLFSQVQTHADQLETRVRERTRELEALYGITAATVEDPDLNSVLRRSLELTLQAFGCPAGAIHLAHDGQRALHPVVYLDRSNRGLAELLFDPEAAGGLLSRLAPNGTPWIVDGDLPAKLFGEPTRAVAVAPLRARDRSLGVLTLVSDTPGRFAGASLLLTTIADQIGAAVENIELRQKARQAAVLEERERLAHELHDAVTQAIYSIGLFAEAARESARAAELPAVERHLQSILQTSHRALGEMRLLLYELRTETLARHGLPGALGERLQSVEHRAEIEYDLRVEGITTLPVALEDTFYRIALEALNNSLRHSRAQRVEVALVGRGGELVMTIRDNGIGFRLREAIGRGGMGLDAMEKRIRKVGGQLKITSRPGRGTRVEARAPLAQPVDGGGSK